MGIGMGMGMWWWEWEGMKIRFPIPDDNILKRTDIYLSIGPWWYTAEDNLNLLLEMDPLLLFNIIICLLLPYYFYAW